MLRTEDQGNHQEVVKIEDFKEVYEELLRLADICFPKENEFYASDRSPTLAPSCVRINKLLFKYGDTRK